MVSLNSSNGKKQELTISTPTIIRVLVSVLVFLLVIAFLRKITYALLLLVLSSFLALALNAPVQWLAKNLPHRKNQEQRTLATIISFLVVVIILGGFISLVTPPIINQTENFAANVPSYVQDVQNKNSRFNQFVEEHHLQGEVQSFSNKLKTRLNNFDSSAFSTARTIVKDVIAFLTILVLTFLMLVEGPRWLRYFFHLMPGQHEKRAEKIANGMYRVVRGYVNGQVILAAIAAALIAPALFILHISDPFALMFVIFLAGLIPFVGHTIGAAIVAIVALFHSWLSAVIILVYYILYINIENYLIQPRLQSLTTNLSPLTVFGAVVVGVTFDGFVGGLLAIPVAGCLKVLVVDYLDRRKMLAKLVEADETVEN